MKKTPQDGKAMLIYLRKANSVIAAKNELEAAQLISGGGYHRIPADDTLTVYVLQIINDGFPPIVYLSRENALAHITARLEEMDITDQLDVKITLDEMTVGEFANLPEFEWG